MKLKILHIHLIKLSENLLSTDTGTHAQKQKEILDIDRQYGNNHQIIYLTYQKHHKTSKTTAFLLKKN